MRIAFCYNGCVQAACAGWVSRRRRWLRAAWNRRRRFARGSSPSPGSSRSSLCLYGARTAPRDPRGVLAADGRSRKRTRCRRRRTGRSTRPSLQRRDRGVLRAGQRASAARRWTCTSARWTDGAQVRGRRLPHGLVRRRRRAHRPVDQEHRRREPGALGSAGRRAGVPDRARSIRTRCSLRVQLEAQPADQDRATTG